MGCLAAIAFFVSLWNRSICGSCSAPRTAAAKRRDGSTHARRIAIHQPPESTTWLAGVDACADARFLQLVLWAKMAAAFGRERVFCSLAMAVVVFVADMVAHAGIPGSTTD
jgi:hypothetical protein